MMKIREGYKETEIGVIPEDWEVERLIDITDKNDRYSFTGGPFGSDLKSSDYTDEGIRVIQLQNIGEGKFYNDSKIYTSEEKANELSSCNIFPNELILAKMADPVARACKIPSMHNRYVMCSDGIRLKVDSSWINVDYCLYSINSSYFRKAAIEHSTGTTRLRIGLTSLKGLRIAIPPLPEQQRIAEILSTTDEHIEKLDKTIEDYHLLKKGMMRKLLTEGIGHTEFKDTEIGRIPKEWEVKKIGEIINLQGGYAFKSKEFSAYGVPIIRISNINNGFIDLRDCVYYPKELTINLDSFLLEEDDTVIAMSGATTGKVGIAPKNILPSYINQRVGRFSINDRKMIDKLFLYYYTNGFYFQEKIWDYAIGGAQPNISGVEIESIFIPIPSISEQKSIASIFKSIDNKIELYQNQQQDYIQLKKALMEQLLTGKIRTI